MTLTLAAQIRQRIIDLAAAKILDEIIRREHPTHPAPVYPENRFFINRLHSHLARRLPRKTYYFF